MRSMVITSCIFNVFWLLCIMGQNSALWLLLPLLTFYFLVNKAVFIPAIVVAVGGSCLDFLLFTFGVFSFSSGGFPPWLAVLWLGFGVFYWQIRPVIERMPVGFFVVGGAGLAVLSYKAGEQLGAVVFPLQLYFTLSLLFVCWLVICALLYVGTGYRIKAVRR
ncbi:DUF2878 family protein [Thaumasiovibrio sp. DFM-14]|uniref:DUF2878 family protein n=1 Tax=Thaumasiovibrio sp. DFM-14 TaxID=3384792 RepID=UPI0039A0A214